MRLFVEFNYKIIMFSYHFILDFFDSVKNTVLVLKRFVLYVHVYI